MNLKTVTLNIDENQNASLLTHLRVAGHVIPAYCAGKGVCGKCKVRFLENAPAWKENEAKFFTEEELKDGWRLACETKVTGTVKLEILDIRVKKKEAEEKKELGDTELLEKAEYVAAVDIGTTTVAVSKIEKNSKTVVNTITGVNDQKVFGADVITRISEANRGKGMMLQLLVRNTLKRMYQKLGMSLETTKSVISCNTTMGHLLQGYNCRTLGVAPYKPVNITLHEFKNMTMLPGISTFLGGDLVSGIIATGMDQKEEISVFVDIGTNAEMAIGNKDRILVASAAAGPALEGGNIIHGMAGIPGAISTVEIIKNPDGTYENQLEVIGDETPAGICGSGVLDTVYELKKHGLIDESGLLAEAYFETGYPLGEKIFFAAKDVREVQLAKAAIRAGLEVLMKEYGVTAGQIDSVYLAGGFAYYMNVKKAVGIGMIPKKLEKKVQIVGNTSLHGAEFFAMEDGPESDIRERFVHAVDISEEILLADHQLFQNLYIENMNF